jgi:hypothetical protein
MTGRDAFDGVEFVLEQPIQEIKVEEVGVYLPNRLRLRCIVVIAGIVRYWIRSGDPIYDKTSIDVTLERSVYRDVVAMPAIASHRV